MTERVFKVKACDVMEIVEEYIRKDRVAERRAFAMTLMDYLVDASFVSSAERDEVAGIQDDVRFLEGFLLVLEKNMRRRPVIVYANIPRDAR
jgi:hypothetical protein